MGSRSLRTPFSVSLKEPYIMFDIVERISNRRILIMVILSCTIYTLIIPMNYLLAVQIDKIHRKLIDFGTKMINV